MNSLWASRAPGLWASYCITAAGLLGQTPLVHGRNAAKGSRQTGCVPLEDTLAPEAKSWGPVVGSVVCGGSPPLLVFSDAGWGPKECLPSPTLSFPWQGVRRWPSVAGAAHPWDYSVAHMELLLCRGI